MNEVYVVMIGDSTNAYATPQLHAIYSTEDKAVETVETMNKVAFEAGYTQFYYFSVMPVY